MSCMQSRTYPPLFPLLPLGTPRATYCIPLSILHLPFLTPYHIRIRLFNAKNNVLKVMASLRYALQIPR
jgi:hypothetical protein